MGGKAGILPIMRSEGGGAMSDCSTQAFKPKLPREHYLDGYRDGIGDSVKSWELPYNELVQRCQQLEQVAREMLHAMWEAGDCGISSVKQDDFGVKLIELGVSLDG